MKRRVGKHLMALAAGIGLALGAMSALAAVTAGKIPGSKHDLSPTGAGASLFTATENATVGTEICVFCHTPHGSQNPATYQLPLWNRNNSTSSFTVYSSPTMEGTSTLSGVEATASLACLSCHDGATARNSMVNAPGSGAQGGSYAGTWSAGTGPMTAVFANLGTDLTNDHPISIPYCGGGLYAATTSTLGGTCSDTDFWVTGTGTVNATTNGGGKVITKTVGSNQTFWVERLGSLTTRNKADIALYTRGTGVGASTNSTPWVECASCHDPHNASTATQQVSFLRDTNAGSQICLTCHNK